MPIARRTRQHVERLDAFGETLTLLIATMEEVTEDGRIEPTEDQLLHRVIARAQAEFPALPAEASVIDGGIGVVITVLNTMSVTTEWTERRINQHRADELQLERAGLLEPVAA